MSEEKLENATSGRGGVSEAKVAPTQCWDSYCNVHNWRRFGECYLWSRNVFEAKVAPAQRSQSEFSMWNVLENATSGHGMCPRQKWLQHCWQSARDAISWSCVGLLPQVAPAHYCGGCRNVARFGYVGKYRLWPRFVSEAGAALALEPRVLRCNNRKLWRPAGATKTMCEQSAVPSSSDMAMLLWIL